VFVGGGTVLYKVTPSLAAPKEEKPKPVAESEAPKEPRKKRRSAVFDADGHEVLITMMCLKCKSMKPLAMFGLRKMADGAIRNQPWCRTCRSGASTKKKQEKAQEVEADQDLTAELPASEVATPSAPASADAGPPPAEASEPAPA
jgi:hypothetical protein